MTEPFGRAAGVAALVGVDPAAWLSEEQKQKGHRYNERSEITNKRVLRK